MTTGSTHRFWPPPGTAEQARRACDHAGCAQAGEYRAPKSRDSLRDYYWFCLDHVREYNRGWDFCAGMSTAEIEAMVRADTTWQRASWPLGRLVAGRLFRFDGEWIRDSFDHFGEEFRRRAQARKAKPSPEESARQVMEISGPFTLASLKARYRELCKRHHPDTNAGDKAAEERFKEVGQAYRTLLASLSYT